MTIKINNVFKSCSHTWILIGGLSCLWLWLISNLMIAPVWDESNIFSVIKTGAIAKLNNLERIAFLWTNFFYLYRPLPSTLLALTTDYLNFIQLRYINAALLLISFYLLVETLHLLGISALSRVGFAVCLLFSSASLISATWFANIFDVTCLLLIAIGLFAAVKNFVVVSGIAFGLAFFCKEIVFAGLISLLFMYSNKKICLRTAMLITSLGTAIGICYWVIRFSLVSFGSAQDVHNFDSDLFYNSSQAFVQSFLWQNLKWSADSWQASAGLFGLFIVIAGLKSGVNKLIAILLLSLTNLAYWGMFAYQGETMLNSLNFIGRLYLVPWVLLVFMLVVASHRLFVLILVSCFAWLGMWQTFHDHAAFQQTYLHLYQLAETCKNPLKVHYPEKPLHDSELNLVVGDYPDAPLQLGTKGEFIYTHKVLCN